MRTKEQLKGKNDIDRSPIADVKNACPKNFIDELAKTTELLSKEQNASSMNVIGKLIKLRASGEIIIVGDLHGDLESLSKILTKTEFQRKVENRKDIKIIFLGDYGDRGKNSPEVILLILRLKNKWPENVILMRGNHETPFVSPHELPHQLEEKYGLSVATRIYMNLSKVFEYFYTCVIIEGAIVLFHAGPPSRVNSLEDIAYADQKNFSEALEEMLWSDPKENIKGTQVSNRGAGKLFGSDVTDKILKLLGVQLLVRGHESCVDGYKTNHDGKVLTVFSTNKTPYCNKYACYVDLNFSKKIDLKQIKRHIIKM